MADNELALAPPPADHNRARPVDLARERVDALVTTGTIQEESFLPEQNPADGPQAQSPAYY